MKMKHFLKALMVVVLCVVLSQPAMATNRVNEIAVEVNLYPDGTAHVMQTWSGSFDEKTECYFPITNLGDMSLYNLRVWDDQGDFETLEVWDTKGSLEEKARKCGLNPVNGGYEVCWGISQYGENQYTVEYQLGGMVASYDDFDGFLFQFVPQGMSTGPTDVTVRIVTEAGISLTEENTAIWAFGYEGQIGFAPGGEVVAYTEQPLTEDNSVILMLQMNKGIVSPERRIEGSFETVKERAFVGSDYSQEEGMGFAFWCIIAVAATAGVGILIWVCGAEGRRIDKVYQSADYFREAPIGGNLEASFVLSRKFHQSNDDGNLIAAVLTKLLSEGCLSPITQVDVGFMGREQKAISLKLIQPPKSSSVTAKRLYTLLELASGEDRVLQEDELENYCKTNYLAMMEIVQEAQRDGLDTLDGVGCYKSMLHTDTLAGLTPRGNNLLLQIMGYKKYLLDFSLIAERGVSEAIIWQDCMTYGALLGIAEQVMKQLKKHYPDARENQALQNVETSYYIAYRYHRVTYQAAKQAEEAKRTAGSGGSSSMGGGGGFSGGGSGGGTR